MILCYEKVYSDLETEENEISVSSRDEALEIIEDLVMESNSPFVNPEGWSLEGFKLVDGDTYEDLQSYANQFVKDWNDEEQW